MKLAIGICNNRPIDPLFFQCFMAMCAELQAWPQLEAFELMLRRNCSSLPNGRESVVREAIARKFSHLLFCDDDMAFPPDAAIRLAKHRRAVVGINYVKKSLPVEPCVLGLDGNRVSSKGKKGVEEVGRIGFGMLLIRLGAIEKIPPPLFPMQWSPDHSAYRGEDYAFCDILAENNVRINCDHDLSLECGHTGTFTYGFEHEQDNAKAG